GTIDADGDGYSEIQEDCNDSDASIHPGASEICGDVIDQDCDGRDLADVDNDGYNSVEVGGTDCDDRNMAIHPGAPEIKGDGIDQDCDGDDNTSTSVYWIEDPDSCDGMGWEGDCDSCSSEYEIELECPES
ncbi:MAG: putative metal-binding motif-containing protein, partial [bacterium]